MGWARACMKVVESQALRMETVAHSHYEQVKWGGDEQGWMAWAMVYIWAGVSQALTDNSNLAPHKDRVNWEAMLKNMVSISFAAEVSRSSLTFCICSSVGMA